MKLRPATTGFYRRGRGYGQCEVLSTYDRNGKPWAKRIRFVSFTNNRAHNAVIQDEIIVGAEEVYDTKPQTPAQKRKRKELEEWYAKFLPCLEKDEGETLLGISSALGMFHLVAYQKLCQLERVNLIRRIGHLRWTARPA